MDEQKDPTLQQGAIPPSSGGSSVRLSPTGGVPAAPASGGAGSLTAGGQFGSLTQYLAANQGQAQPLANTLTQGIGKQYQDLSGGNAQTASDISSQVAAGAAPGSDKANATIAAEAAGPAAFAADPNNVKAFQGLLSASYSGPLSAESTTGYQAQQNKINQAIATGQGAVSTEAGREGLLQPVEAAPTQGVTALNSAILSQDPNALRSVETAYEPFKGLVTDLSQKASAANQEIAGQQAAATQDVSAANQAIADQAAGLNKAVGGQLTAAQSAAQARNAQVAANIKSGNVTDADLAAIGVTRDQWNSLSAAQKAAATPTTVTSARGQFGAQTGTANVDLAPFLTQTNPQDTITAANVATPEQYAAAKALQDLVAGTQGAPPTLVINPSASAQAGTAPTNLNQFDYQAALNAAQATRQDEVAAAQAYVDALQNGADEQHAQLAAQDAQRKSKEQAAELISGVGAPLAVASQLPVIGKPVQQAVDTVVQAVTGGTWICTAMQQAGVMTQAEIDRLHAHLFQATLFKPWSFIKYGFLGKPLVVLANLAGVDWNAWKTPFYHIPMAEPNYIHAVEMYESAFWVLAKHSMKTLWDRINA